MLKNKYFIDQKVYRKRDVQGWLRGEKEELEICEIEQVGKICEKLRYIVDGLWLGEDEILSSGELAGFVDNEADSLERSLQERRREAQNRSCCGCEIPIQILGQTGYFVKTDSQQEENQE